MSKFRKYLFISLGILATGLGLLGVILPVLPTTPFLLLAAILFSNSSEKFLHWLLTNKLCGGYIRNYREGKGMLLKQKIFNDLALMAHNRQLSHFLCGYLMGQNRDGSSGNWCDHTPGPGQDISTRA